MPDLPGERLSYRYTECGLDNVVIEGIDLHVDDSGEQVLHIPAVNALHKTIAHGIVESDTGMSGQELRFLRTMMGLTQAELGQRLHRDAQSIARWEKNQTPIGATSEMVIRLLAGEKLDLEGYRSVERVSAKCVPGGTRADIVIDASEFPRYKLAA